VEGDRGAVANRGATSDRGAVAELLARVRFVLCRPREPRNVGAAARALRNAGVHRLVLVDPQCDPRSAEAYRLAVHAGPVLDAARVVATLEEALAGAALSAGATARTRPERPPLSPRDCVALLAEAACERRRPTEVALVFGDERAGLTAAEVERVDRVTSIPGAPGQPSWNLAQAVAIYAYEMRTACLAQAEHGSAPADRHEAGPAEMAALDRALAATLEPLARTGTRRRLYRTLERARLTEREASLWSAVLSALRRALQR
jgi:tRNA/rRNA methyltransferase/tRNA (cytidine32/uridine32-2'-O)-methyltransferase